MGDRGSTVIRPVASREREIQRHRVPARAAPHGDGCPRRGTTRQGVRSDRFHDRYSGTTRLRCRPLRAQPAGAAYLASRSCTRDPPEVAERGRRRRSRHEGQHLAPSRRAEDGKSKLRDGHACRCHERTPIGESQPSDHFLPLRHGDTRPGGRQVGVRPGGCQRTGAAPVRLLLRHRAMKAATAATVIDDRCSAATTGVEGIFAEVLADVLRVDRVPVDSHFFEELGADSLVMAHFCARVRKRGDLPPVSMRDVYAHPTIRSLAEALADVAHASTKPPAPTVLELPTPTNTRDYILCGALQALFFLAYCYVAVLAISKGYAWVSAAPSVAQIYLRLVLLNIAAFVFVSAVPIAAKWVLVGRWKARQIRIWSLAYVRFWIVKTLVRSSPAARLFIGTPLYLLYLRALGAKIGPGVVIFSRRVPVCTDLLTIGAGSVIRKEAIFLCYRAQAGRLETGPVTLGRDVFVGERSVLDINTCMGDGAQLGHASALHSGQAVPAGEWRHGCPAQRTDVDYVRVPPARCGTLRRAAYSAAALLAVLLLYLPLVQAGFSLAIVAASSLAEVLVPSARAGTLWGLVIEALIFSLVLFFGLALVGLLLTGAVSRVLNAFIKPDTVYPLYGFHDAAHRAIARIGRMRFFTYLFGDSSYIVHFLQWLGYRLSPVMQTGVNFGTEVMHPNPSLSAVGTGTMVADGLHLVNDEVSSTSFRVSRVAIGPQNFLGNDITYPARGRTGDNVLLGTKVLVPLDGKIREGVGLLGAPCFEIPRSVERDMRFDHLRTGEALRRGLAAKNRCDLQTIGVFLFTRW